MKLVIIPLRSAAAPKQQSGQGSGSESDHGAGAEHPGSGRTKDRAFPQELDQRVWEHGSIILIMTRWHEDDLAGRLLLEQADDWEVLRLTALAETQEERDANNERLGLGKGQPDPLGRAPGEPLCPRRYSLAALESLRKDVGSLAWAGQYSGTPRAAEGNRFKRQWLVIVDALPTKAAERVRYWDCAASEGQGAYTAGVLLARGHDGLWFVEDVVRGQWSPLQRAQVMKQTAQTDAHKYGNRVHIWIEREPGGCGKEVAQSMIRMLAGFPVSEDHVTDSKEIRAEPLAVQAEAGNVRLLRAPWNGQYIEELCAFPNGRYKDQVDASAGAFNKLAAKSMGGMAPYLGLPGPILRRPIQR